MNIVEPSFELDSFMGRFGFCNLYDYFESLNKVISAFKFRQASSQGERMLLEVNHLFQLLVGNNDTVIEIKNHALISVDSMPSAVGAVIFQLSWLAS